MFADRLKQLRASQKHTQESMAELLGVTKQQVYRWERGENEPSGETVANIAKTFNITADWLLGLVDEPHKRLKESELSPMERRLLTALRAGEMIDAIEVMLGLAKDAEEKR